MTSSQNELRVALAVQAPWGYGGDIVRGALSYRESSTNWRFVGDGATPFTTFDRIDLTQVDGVVGFIRTTQHAEKIAQSGVPTVNVSGRLQDLPLPRVVSDDLAVGRMAADHLLERGFAQFGFVGFDSTWFTRQRLAGFSETIAQAGQQCVVLDDLPFAQVPRIEAIRDWLASVAKPIGVMAVNDLLARRVIDLAHKMELRIPDDVAVLGVDNDPWAMASAVVPMSSVEMDGWTVGYRAAISLNDLMAGKAPTPDQYVPPLRVVARRSTDISLAEDELVNAALAFIRTHCHEGIEVEVLLDQLQVSRRTLERRMKAAIGQTPRAAIGRAQIDQAKQMLVKSDKSLHQIAVACGFRRQARLCELFKRLTGITPGQYRQKGMR